MCTIDSFVGSESYQLLCEKGLVKPTLRSTAVDENQDTAPTRPLTVQPPLDDQNASKIEKVDTFISILDEFVMEDFDTEEEHGKALVAVTVRLVESLREEYGDCLDDRDFSGPIATALLNVVLAVTGPEFFITLVGSVKKAVLSMIESQPSSASLEENEPVEATVTSLLSEEERQALLQRQQQDEDQEPTAMRIALQRVQPQAEHRRRGKGGK